MLAAPSASLRSVRATRVPGPRKEYAPDHRDPYWTRLFPLLAALACVTRAPSFRWPLWNPDEGYLAVQARLLADGGTLYETVVDRKPPLVPWLYAGAFALFGDDSLLPLKALAVAAQLLTAVLLASIARRRWGDRAGRTAGVLYLLISIGLNPEDAQAATFEVFTLPCTAAAMWCADRRGWGAAGAAVACAFLAKQTGGAVLLPVAWLLWRDGAPRGDVLRLAAGLCGPVVAAAVLTTPAGFLFWTVTGSGAYASFTGSELHVLGRGLGNAAILAAACAGIVPPVVRVLRIARTGSTDLWLWLASAVAAVLLGFHFFGHYYLQLMPPLALLGAAALQILPRERTLRAIVASGCGCAVFLAWGLLAPRPELAHATRLAETVRAHSGPRDRVLFWGMHPEAYWLADRAPASRYLTAGLLTNYSGGRNGPQVGEKYGVAGSWPVFREELRRHPPTLVVDDSRGEPYAPHRVPSLRRILATGYRPLLTVDGAVLYVRPGGGPGV
ncbi:ArnT family glycosyltransferase [Streptomyces kanamyceticus]|uniref:Glycosyltransferase n=1 Tax=Streptomyces kanamyceticus TaxID=1967 RepID=A0A5J6G999_STRKN|nr:glycosyltransferase family 39 protein [Streptomyces kanamyceticus]QEU91184.1 glycosyltransferase [Streptomyces kanamyceticus]